MAGELGLLAVMVRTCRATVPPEQLVELCQQATAAEGGGGGGGGGGARSVELEKAVLLEAEASPALRLLEASWPDVTATVARWVAPAAASSSGSRAGRRPGGPSPGGRSRSLGARTRGRALE